LMATLASFGALVFLLIFAAVVCAFISANAGKKADQSAKVLCTAIPVGSEIEAIVRAEAKNTDGSRLLVYEGNYRFLFKGGLFHSSECAVNTLNGKVISVQFKSDDY